MTSIDQTFGNQDFDPDVDSRTSRYDSTLAVGRPKYRRSFANAPYYDTMDFAAIAVAALITLGPLAAYAFGYGA